MNRSEFQKVKEVKLHKELGLQFADPSNGRSLITIQVDDRHINTAGVFHGGLIYCICDVAAFIALTSVIEEGELGVTNNIAVQVMRSVKRGALVEFRGEVIKQGKRLVFLESTAISNGKIIAKATITKTMI